MSDGGWSSLSMLERYSHLAPQDVRRQMDELSPHRRLQALEARGVPTGTAKTNNAP